jgi:aminopeptidase N
VTNYFYDNWFTVASPDDLQEAFEEASGQDLEEIWSHWFEEAAGEDDI